MSIKDIVWKVIGFIGEIVGALRGWNPWPWKKRPKHPLYGGEE